MEEERQTPPQPKITDQIKEYFNTQYDLIRLKGVLKASSIIASVITAIFVFICALIFFFFLIITLALFLGEVVFHSYWQGFGAVCVLVLLIAVIVAVLKKRVIQPPVINILISKIFKEDK